jgi:cytochrome d ubiquinol oxidase subunit II
VTFLSLIATMWIRPELLTNYNKLPIGYAIPLLVVAALMALQYLHSKGNEKGAFVCSCLYLVGMLGGAAFASYPTLLAASTDPAYSLTIRNTATSDYGMKVGLVWWTIGILIAIGYFVFLFRMFKGKVTVSSGEYGH